MSAVEPSDEVFFHDARQQLIQAVRDRQRMLRSSKRTLDQARRMAQADPGKFPNLVRLLAEVDR